MRTRTIISALAFAALATAGPALAQGRGGGHGGGHGGGVGAGIGAGHGGGLNSGIGLGRGADRIGVETGLTTRTEARINSRGPDRASATAIGRVNQNSVLYGTTVAAGPLTGLSVGMNVLGSGGASVGTIERIVTSNNGTVRTVLVRSADGRRTYSLAPRTLTVSGGVVTTTRL